MTHAAESTHYYTRTGEPAYTVKAKAGHDRPTTVADARKLGLVPSVTTVIRCADRPGLTNWMIDQAILAALTLPVIEGETSEAYLARIKRDSKEQARKAALRGTAIHAAIQGHYEGSIQLSRDFKAHIEGADAALYKWSQWKDWRAEQSFAHPLGFGGKVDLRASSLFVADVKTKEFNEDAELKAWDEHALQLAAYREGLGMPSARCAICYVSVTTPGLARLIEIPEEELKRGWKMFLHLLNYWKAKNKFASDFATVLVAA
jgi:hypothetical protein